MSQSRVSPKNLRRAQSWSPVRYNLIIRPNPKYRRVEFHHAIDRVQRRWALIAAEQWTLALLWLSSHTGEHVRRQPAALVQVKWSGQTLQSQLLQDRGGYKLIQLRNARVGWVSGRFEIIVTIWLWIGHDDIEHLTWQCHLTWLPKALGTPPDRRVPLPSDWASWSPDTGPVRGWRTELVPCAWPPIRNNCALLSCIFRWASAAGTDERSPWSKSCWRWVLLIGNPRKNYLHSALNV